MGQGANQDLLENSGTANRRSKTLTANANDVYGFLDPTLVKEATNPSGYAPEDLSAMNTAAQQSSGGGTAAVTGAADLSAARTRNAGGFQGALSSASRNAMKLNSENALNVQAENAKLKEAQKQQALSSLQSLYGVDENTALGYLNASDSALGAENQSHPLQQGFDTFSNVLSSLTGAAKAAKPGGF